MTFPIGCSLSVIGKWASSFRSAAARPPNQAPPDLSFNRPRAGNLCNLSSSKVGDNQEPKEPTPAVATWSTLRLRPAKRFARRGSRGTESRKAMETAVVIPDAIKPEVEAGGQRAERQWRPYAVTARREYDRRKPGDREPKGNGDSDARLKTCPTSPKPGDREPKGNGDKQFKHDCTASLSKGGQCDESRKAMET